MEAAGLAAAGQPGALLCSAAALEAAAAQVRELASGHEAARGELTPNESDLCVVAMAACLVLLHQAQVVAGVLDAAAAPSVAADRAETVGLVGSAAAGEGQDGKV